MPKGSNTAIPAPIKTVWSTIDISKFGPLKEARMIRLARLAWGDPDFKKELFARPKEILEREASVVLSAQTKLTVIEEDSRGPVHFVVPITPPQSELTYRLEQIADWWMLAHTFYYFMSRMEHGEQAAALLDGVQVALLARIWTDSEFRKGILSDPKSALEKETGMKFPAMKSIEDTEDQITMVLPLAPKNQKMDDGFETMGSWFMIAHTMWWFLMYPRLLSRAYPVVTDWVG
jgi:hypothetical protein